MYSVFSPVSSRYSNVHWNWPATALILVCGSADTISTLLSVCHEMTNRNATMSVGTTVHTTSAMAFPWSGQEAQCPRACADSAPRSTGSGPRRGRRSPPRSRNTIVYRSRMRSPWWVTAWGVQPGHDALARSDEVHAGNDGDGDGDDEDRPDRRAVSAVRSVGELAMQVLSASVGEHRSDAPPSRRSRPNRPRIGPAP